MDFLALCSFKGQPRQDSLWVHNSRNLQVRVHVSWTRKICMDLLQLITGWLHCFKCRCDWAITGAYQICGKTCCCWFSKCNVSMLSDKGNSISLISETDTKTWSTWLDNTSGHFFVICMNWSFQPPSHCFPMKRGWQPEVEMIWTVTQFLVWLHVYVTYASLQTIFMPCRALSVKQFKGTDNSKEPKASHTEETRVTLGIWVAVQMLEAV